MTKYYTFAKVDILQKLMYIWNELFSGIFITIILFIFFHIWTTIFAGKEVVQGFTLVQIMWYFALAEIGVIAIGEWIDQVGEEVRTGTLATFLLKPMNYVGAKFAVYMGTALYKLLILGLFAFSIVYSLVGSINFSAEHIIFTFVTFILANILNFVLTMCMGLMAFWFEDVSALYWMYQKSIFVMGGLLAPLDVYPIWFREIVQYLPFSFITYAPAKLFAQFNADMAIVTIAGQLVWIAFGVMALYFIYRRGIKQVVIHGG
ncbi:ABC-2 family transporter protein [Candidatus Woesearchaeota archaeon]|nr:ABC-2 family transporter protein [Candidatus Woesearchaeota archaeon]